MPQSRLRNAPIREAIVDIQGVAPSSDHRDALLKRLAAPLDGLQDTFATREDIEQRNIEISRDSGTKVDALQLGSMFRATAIPNKAIQFRLNGYTFSWLRPYSSWDELVSGARQGWDIYLRRVPGFAINRLAVRFINELSVPFPAHDLDQYLLGIPKPLTDPEDHATLRQFTDQRVSSDLPSGATVGLTRLIHEPPSGGLEGQAFIDIDVFRLVQFDSGNTDGVWDVIQTFRAVKNSIFYKCIGPAAIERCGGKIAE